MIAPCGNEYIRQLTLTESVTGLLVLECLGDKKKKKEKKKRNTVLRARPTCFFFPFWDIFFHLKVF